MKQANTYIQIRQAGTYYLDNIRMYRTYQDTVFVGGFDVDMAYRYGFQGQEKDDEIKGEGNSINYKYRMHDPRIGRFFAVDPLSGDYPFYSPYAFSGNRVLDAVELEGLEPSSVHLFLLIMKEKRQGSFIELQEKEKMIWGI